MQYLTDAFRSMPKNAKNVRAVAGALKLTAELLHASAVVESRLKPAAQVVALKAPDQPKSKTG